MSWREPLVEKLARAQRALLQTAGRVPAEQWTVSPRDRAWSAAQVVAHLMMIERAIISSAGRVLLKPPKNFPLLKRFHLPLAIVEGRMIHRKTPIPLDPELVREKEAMLAELREVREGTLAFIDETKARDLSIYRWSHAFLGTLDTYAWLELVASHELRHVRQIEEIAADLPKGAAGSL